MKITNKFASLKPYFPSHLSYNLLKKSFYTILLSYDTFFIQLSYFMIISLLGYLSLSVFTNPRIKPVSSSKELDLFFTSVSATTVSSMSAIEMEAFSNSQLIIITILMLLGGEIFTSMLGIHMQNLKLRNKLLARNPNSHANVDVKPAPISSSNDIDNIYLKLSSLKYLGYVVLGYLFVVHALGSLFIYSYFTAFSHARRVLDSKGIKVQTFSVFVTVSTFANCGYVPTNENMIVFKRNPGLLLLVASQVLLGNTLCPIFLRIAIWVVAKTTKRRELVYALKNHGDLGYDHLLSGLHTACLALTAFMFVSVQFVLFCAMEWNSETLKGLSLYEKSVASLFQVVNSRHAGESVVDLSLISPAILVLFVVMMYLPPYTSFFPMKDQRNVSTHDDHTPKNKSFLESLICSNLSYLAIFVVMICITEREKMKNDPLNFNVLNVIIEVISAYGNVGLSTGYSCKRQVNPEANCEDVWYSFSGKWSSQGKFILIIVMFFGRLKKFNMQGGKAWKLF